jgi:hypothetical protein
VHHTTQNPQSLPCKNLRTNLRLTADFFLSEEQLNDKEYEGVPPATPEMFYINKAATTVLEAFKSMSDNLNDWALTTGFSASSIVEEFGLSEESKPNPWAIASGAMSMASGATAAFAPVSGAFSMVSGVFAIAAEFEPSEEDLAADIQTQVATYFTKSKDAIQTTLNNIFGVKPDDQPYDMNTLPGQTEEYFNDTPLGRFFADGKWLMYNVNDIVKPILEKGNTIMVSPISSPARHSQDWKYANPGNRAVVLRYP